VVKLFVVKLLSGNYGLFYQYNGLVFIVENTRRTTPFRTEMIFFPINTGKIMAADIAIFRGRSGLNRIEVSPQHTLGTAPFRIEMIFLPINTCHGLAAEVTTSHANQTTCFFHFKGSAADPGALVIKIKNGQELKMP
jgi:hypothetical protein